jgi:ADP-ribosylglycohydrolase
MGLPADHVQRMARVARSLEGLSLGDAFGERFFGPPGTMTARIQARELPAAPWRWTDDTAMAVGIRDVLHRHGHVDRDALAEVFARRFREDPWRGYGPKAQEILELIYSGTPWAVAARAPYRDGSKGNGGAMRAAPVGAYFADDLDRAAAEARASAEVTHAHPEGKAGAIAVAVAAGWAARGESGSLFDAALPRLDASETRARLELAAAMPATLPVWQVATRLGAGEQVLAEDTVPFALWCASVWSGAYEEALWQTVSALGDRDTTCAIVGGIVALRSPPPSGWIPLREPVPEAL